MGHGARLQETSVYGFDLSFAAFNCVSLLRAPADRRRRERSSAGVDALR